MSDPHIEFKGSDYKGGNTGFIQAFVYFITMDGDWHNVSGDVISISTEQGSGKQDSDAVAKMMVTLDNKNFKYTEKFIPHNTLVASWILVQRNIPHGKNIYIETQLYDLFYGRVQEVTMTNLQCVVDCGDESSQLLQSVTEDYTWYPNIDLPTRVKDVVKAIGTNCQLHVFDYRGLDPEKPIQKDIHVEQYASTGDAANTTVTQHIKTFGAEWAVPSDQPFRLLILDDGYVEGGIDSPPLDVAQFTIDPGDNESIVGSCNRVIVVVDTDFEPLDPNKNVPTSSISKAGVKVIKENKISQKKYGVIEAPIYRLPNHAAKDADGMAQNILNIYNAYEDRLIKIKVCNIIPVLYSKIKWQLWGYDKNYRPHLVTTIIGKVQQKNVHYDTTNGLVVDLECKRYGTPLGGDKYSNHNDGTNSNYLEYPDVLTDDSGAQYKVEMTNTPDENNKYYMYAAPYNGPDAPLNWWALEPVQGIGLQAYNWFVSQIPAAAGNVSQYPGPAASNNTPGTTTP